MSQSNHAQILEDIQGKIEREKKLIQGFQQLKKITDNPEVVQRCNNQIRETQSNMDYLHETLMKLQLQDSNSNLTEQLSSVSTATSRPKYNRFDLIKYDCPSLGHKIQYMLQQLQFKLQVENQYKEANEKILHLYMQDGDKSSSSAARTGRMESDQRVQLLNKALKRYQDMHVNVEEVSRDMQLMNTPKYARRPLSGILLLRITCIRDVDHIAPARSGKKPESVVSVKVDDVERARTKASKNSRWNEEFQIDVEKGHEIEISVYDKSANIWLPVAVTWASLSDIAEELRRKKVAQENGNENWMPAYSFSNSGKIGDESSANMSQNTVVNSSVTPDSNTLEPIESTISMNAESRGIVINTWLTLEPVGQILVTIGFSKHNSVNSKGLMGALGRHGAIRQKKEEVFRQYGHQFVQKQFYNIMCCALCGEFLRYTGYQCRDCKFLCHKKCFEKVVTKCIAKSSVDEDPDEAKLNHRIPHRFEPVTNRGTKWCCHCGYILPWGRKNVRKCTECGVMCHTYCTHLVPDFCGMSMDMANKILATIKSTKGNARSPQRNTKPLTMTSHSDSNISPLLHKKLPQTRTEKNDNERSGYMLPTQTANEFQQRVDKPSKIPSRKPVPPIPQELSRNAGTDYVHEADLDHHMDLSFNATQPFDTYHGDLAQNNRIDVLPEEYTQSKHDTTAYATQERKNLGNFDYDSDSMAYHHAAAENAEYSMQIPQHVDSKLKKESPTKQRKKRRKIGLDDFQFLAVLGKGNFGKVMLAESRRTSQLCAIKVLKKDFYVENDEAESVRCEKRVFLVANKEKHPFLINLHCCFQTENRIYFVMEYIHGGDLMWHIQKSRFSAKRAKFYACEVLLALKYFHDNGIIYRDLKLDNILLTTRGHVKIADYGLCKDNMWYQSRTNTFCGTPGFMAPEIIAGKEYDRSVDWWAFGVLLFQMLLCQSPFKGDDEDEIFNAVENDDVKYPISMPRSTVLVLQALLTKDSAQRLGSTQRDALDIMEHPYFSDVDFDEILHCRVKPPFLPEVNGENDFSNFDQEFTSETPRLTPVEAILTSEMQEQFRGFSHISDDAPI